MRWIIALASLDVPMQPDEIPQEAREKLDRIQRAFPLSGR